MADNIITACIISFISVALAELGDKTQLCVALFAANTKQKTKVFLSGFLALSIAAILAVILAVFLANVIDLTILNLIAAITFIGIGFLTLKELNKHFEKCITGSCFISVLLAEMGDKTQLMEIALIWRFNNVIPVLFGTLLAFFVITILSIALGLAIERLGHKKVHILSGTLFILFGILMIIGIF